MISEWRDLLTHSQLEPVELTSFQRILLVADGTLTKILEAHLTEALEVVKLSEKIITTTKDILPLEIKAGCEVIKRNILLQGQITQRNWLYAESIIVIERLDKNFRDKLISSDIPIGKLWSEHKIETFKEVIVSAREPAGNLAKHFEIARTEKLLYRTYRVFSKQQPVMMITEKFPESYFTDMMQ
ncbi:MAG: chorismate lyase [Proteobacteria bacterium]|nr:chorismate lyase [Pseudomonadota bacterium]